MNQEPTTLKEILFSDEIVADFAEAVHYAWPEFDRAGFLVAVLDAGWEDRALMARLRHVTVTLHDFLPADYRRVLELFMKVWPNMPQSGFILLVPSDFVAVYGLDDYEASIPALEQFTKGTSAEFAVRPFIAKYPKRMMAQMKTWSLDPDPDVRRLASEGCRPRLPWGIRLNNLVDDPRPILPILENLKNDPSESVRRSVANNLNDISKDHPDLVLEVLRGWIAADPDSAELAWITNHALRTLIKAGDPAALELLGYPREPQIEVRSVAVEPGTISIGGSVTLSYEIVSTGNGRQRLMIDYIVHHLKANRQHSPKVFKHKKVDLGPGQVLQVKKVHSFRPVTTRKYYPGPQAIQPQINGQPYDRIEFTLIE